MLPRYRKASVSQLAVRLLVILSISKDATHSELYLCRMLSCVYVRGAYSCSLCSLPLGPVRRPGRFLKEVLGQISGRRTG